MYVAKRPYNAGLQIKKKQKKQDIAIIFKVLKKMEIGIDCKSNDRKRTTSWMHLLAVKKNKNGIY